MKTKLDRVKAKKAKQSKQEHDIAELVTELKRFHQTFHPQQPIDLTELQKELTELPGLISQPITKSLESFVAHLDTHHKTQKQPNLSELIKEIVIDNKIDIEPIAKEIAGLKVLADKKEVDQSQLASDYLPYRRVVKLGRRFFFDDNMTPSGSGGGGGNNTPTTVRSGQKSTVTAGTAVALATSTSVQGVIIQGLYSNTGVVYVGDSGVSATTGMELQPGQSTSVAIDDLSKVYIDSAVDAEGVSYIGS